MDETKLTIAAYKDMFATEKGKRVLKDLSLFCLEEFDIFDIASARKTDFNLGANSVIIFIPGFGIIIIITQGRRRIIQFKWAVPYSPIYHKSQKGSVFRRRPIQSRNQAFQVSAKILRRMRPSWYNRYRKRQRRLPSGTIDQTDRERIIMSRRHYWASGRCIGQYLRKDALPFGIQKGILYI